MSFEPQRFDFSTAVRVNLYSDTQTKPSRGMKQDVMVRLADWMDQVIKAPADEAVATRVAGEIREVCNRFPAPGIRI